MGYRAVLFDIGDTLWHSAEAPPAAEFRRIAAARASTFLDGLGARVADPARVARVAWDALEAATRKARATDRAEPNYAAAARAALERIGLRLTEAQAGQLMETIYVSGEDGRKAPFAGARETLEELRRRGFKLGIVTNRAFGGQRFRDDLASAGLGIDWDAVVVSVEVGYLKPHRATFERATKAIDVAARDCVMVGNSLAEDIAGAQPLGMGTAWKRSAPDAEGVVPDFTFDEVPELLDWDVLKEAAR